MLVAAAAAAQAGLGEARQAPDWNDEPPQWSRWVEAGWRAEGDGDLGAAAREYCLAARHGSLQGSYRLARLLLRHPDVLYRTQGHALLAQAAQLGHAQAAQALESLAGAAVPASLLPECLAGGEPPTFARAQTPPASPAAEAAVPHEVVEVWLAGLPPDKRRHARLIQRLAPRFAVDARLALAIARAESNLEPLAVSPRNAQGLMQLIPHTAARFGVRDPFDVEQNVRGGLSYLAWLLERFDGDVALASAAYNAGEGAVERFGGVPPFAETRAYVQRILHFYRARRHERPSAL